ncbi:MAG: ABC transporter substrate-binding protein [Acetobacteraceae bacterium]|nr:ABC transporter substrate-binding protein [Acetobacteraceae bacterium]
MATESRPRTVLAGCRALLTTARRCPAAEAGEPITIGFGEALTANLAVVGKSGLLAQQTWAEDVSARGGLLGRPVKLIV